MEPSLGRRTFLERSALSTVAAAASVVPTPRVRAATPVRRIRVGVIGCGSVSTKYLPHLAACPFVELVSTCDIIPDRAARAAKEHGLAHHYPQVEAMLAGEPFELFVNLTDMQEHEGLNRRALEAGRHVWSEKPLANSLAGGQELLKLASQQGLRIWGAPTAVASPQFAAMAQVLAEGRLGRLAAGHASYGHTGPDWARFFYEQGGGSLPDLGVYQLTTLTGLLGPARSVVALVSTVTPRRQIRDQGEIAVTAEDNAQLLLDHGDGVISHVQCGFNYFSPAEHDSRNQGHHTMTIIGSAGTLALAGYDWAPHGVDLSTREQGRAFTRLADAAHDYVWQNGASLAAECLVTGREPPFTPEHALHVLEIMQGALASQAGGQRVELRSRFAWPLSLA